MFLNRLVFTGIVAAMFLHARAADEQELIAIIQSPASAAQKWSACQQLRLVGTAQSVPALAALLVDERTSHAARHALEGLPYPEAGAALRDALGKTSGLLKAGIVDSLGWRGESEAAPLISPLLSDADATVAAAAAAALGRIGGVEILDALWAQLNEQRPATQPAVHEALLNCAERLVTSNEQARGASIYRRLFSAQVPAQVRMGAWRGLVLTDAGQRSELVLQALSGSDPVLRAAAMKLLRERNDPALARFCASHWSTLPAESQLAVLDAQMPLGSEALPIVRSASQSGDDALRSAAWLAFGELNDLSSIPALSKAAAAGAPSERDAARESLARLRGPAAREALLAHLKTAPENEQPELLRAFGSRGDRAAVDVLLQHATSKNVTVRVAALDSLRTLAPAGAVAPLLEIAAKSSSDEERDPVLKALYAVCEASPDKAMAARSVVSALEKFPPSERRQILPLLAELATPEALRATEAATRDRDLELAREAVRVLAQWPNAAPAESLLTLAGSAQDRVLRTLALRSAIQVSGQESDPGRRLTLLHRALGTADTADETKQVLGQLGQIATADALELALKSLTARDLENEAALAAVSIAEKMAPDHPNLADAAAERVLARIEEGEVARRAWALRLKPASAESFLRNWVLSGPYSESGATGANAVFKVPFAPEKTPESVEWKVIPSAEQVNLAALFPGAENCAAYLRTVIIAPADCRGALLLGSDDGVKAWLNGQVVHSNNVDRGQIVDQDTAPIQLKEGKNDLMLKVSQGGGGWSACARLVGSDGKPIPGLLADRPIVAKER